MDGFDVQHPYDLPESARFKFENGVYTTWVLPGDKPHDPTSMTNPRTEMRWHTNFSSGQWMWSGDVMYEMPTNSACVMQIKAAAPGEALYLRVTNGDLRNSGDPPFVHSHYNKWFHLTVQFNADTLDSKVYVDNCLAQTSHYTHGSANFYIKNGVYGCSASVCRSNFKNITLWKK